ncbi:hypothetical protein [Streptomyces amakusaensis]|uniref:Uncharacterized protein n=1 Tax=Streptomyces amakusaensis TaxID=67271 RepID=A0ABW0ARY3_9ACTN
MPPSFVHRITKYDPADRDEHGHYTGAEEAVSDHGPVEAAYLNAARFHRLTPQNLDAARTGLGPRALLTVWPDLNPDVGAVLATLPEEGSAEFVWETQNGTIRHAVVDDTEYDELATLVADARAACALPVHLDERHPLLCAALPDGDGVLRARW